jgi:phytoene desaturase (3,4-didehydrolycopene-forming)
MYLGLSPYDAPATYSLLQYTEYADGVWYPLGGMFKIAESLRAIAEKNGVRFRFDTEVSGIKTTSGKVTKVQVNKGKEEIAADVVVCNADLP